MMGYENRDRKSSDHNNNDHNNSINSNGRNSSDQQQQIPGKRLHTKFTNPFLPLDIYIPDGEPKVYEGRVYLYGSKDEYGGEYCCHKFHVYSAPVTDLSDWTDHGPVLASTDEYESEGIQDGVDWSDGLLWAPDVVERDGVYYFYFCLSDGSEGVASSTKPYGPFTNAKRMTMEGKPLEGIDPSVLKDGDDFYYTWGQGDVRMAKLNDDMCTLDPTTFVPSLISHKDGCEGFHEGSSLRKIGDYYCIVYASEYQEAYPNRGGRPVKLDYAVSRQVYGPYERRGTIIDNTGVDPQSWNNHGSIIKIGDQWYVFYHGSSNNCKYTRRARVEKICVDEKAGIIQQAQITSSGFADSIAADVVFEAPYAYQVTGGAYFTQDDKGFPMGNITHGCECSFRYLDFGEETGTWEIKLELDTTQENGGDRTAFCPFQAVILTDEKEIAEVSFEKAEESACRMAALGTITGMHTLTIRFVCPEQKEQRLGRFYRFTLQVRPSFCANK